MLCCTVQYSAMCYVVEYNAVQCVMLYSIIQCSVVRSTVYSEKAVCANVSFYCLSVRGGWQGGGSQLINCTAERKEKQYIV